MERLAGEARFGAELAARYCDRTVARLFLYAGGQGLMPVVCQFVIAARAR